jgi:hypothetical protein
MFISCVLLASCATSQIREEPLANPSRRLQFKYFSVLPPQDNDWFLVFSKDKDDKTLKEFARRVGDGKPLGTKSFQPHTINAEVIGGKLLEEES